MQRTLLLILGFCCFQSFIFSQEAKLMLPIGHTGAVNTAQFSPDEKKIVTASKDGTVKIWDTVSGILLADLKKHSQHFAK